MLPDQNKWLARLPPKKNRQTTIEELAKVLQYSDCMRLLAFCCCFYGGSDFDNVAPDWIQQHSNQLQVAAFMYSQQHEFQAF